MIPPGSSQYSQHPGIGSLRNLGSVGLRKIFPYPMAVPGAGIPWIWMGLIPDFGWSKAIPGPHSLGNSAPVALTLLELSGIPWDKGKLLRILHGEFGNDGLCWDSSQFSRQD